MVYEMNSTNNEYQLEGEDLISEGFLSLETKEVTR